MVNAPNDAADEPVDGIEEAQRLVYSEPIVNVFEKPSAVRILVVLSDAMGNPLTVSDIAEQAGVSPQAFYDLREELADCGLILEGPKKGNAKTFRVDPSSEAMQGFMQLRDALIDPPSE